MVPAIDRLLEWTGVELSHVGGVAVGLGPGLFTGLRVGIEAAKALAQVLGVPIVGSARSTCWRSASGTRAAGSVAVIDARRREVFYGLYRPVPGGVTRDGEFRVASPDELAAELEAERDEILLVGNGAILYRQELEQGTPTWSSPRPRSRTRRPRRWSSLAVPEILRERLDRPADLVPIYLRKSDAEIAWDQRARSRLSSRSSRMRRRHLKGVMAIERQVYPRPWSPNLFLSEMSEPRNRSLPGRARSAATSSATAG